jgi:hypothetical protein
MAPGSVPEPTIRFFSSSAGRGGVIPPRPALEKTMSRPISMHEARTALNRDPELRRWAEEFLKNKERAAQPAMSDEELDKHWLYVRPERMHEGAIEAVGAYRQRTEEQ